jgi:hypothetical protein
MPFASYFLQSAIKHLTYYKELGDKTFAQLTNANFHYQPTEASNSIAIIIQHMAGNMLSRFTDFLTTDGEKDWRNRDTEFEEQQLSKQQLIDFWEKGWQCCLDTLYSLTEEDLLKTVYIRNEGLLAVDAINRQLAHYSYHVGQIIYAAKIITNTNWQNLSIAKGALVQFNQQITNKE